MLDHSQSAESILPAAIANAVVSLGSSIRVEDLRCELRIYRDEHVPGKSLGTSCKVVAEDLNTVCDGDLDNRDWPMADI